MGKTQYLTAASVDGFIADPDNSLEWLFQVPESDTVGNVVAEFFSQVGAFAMGATTYEWMSAHEPAERWREWYGDTPCWVFTHRELTPLPGANLRFVQGDVAPVHQAMAEVAGDRNIWLVGGGELVGEFADHGLLDEIILSVAPVTLGGGAPLLPRRMLSSRLRLMKVEQAGQFANLTYEVARPEPLVEPAA